MKPTTITFDEYQRRSRETAVYPALNGRAYLYPLVGLMGESGELAEKIKKLSRDDAEQLTDERRDGIVKEAGDTLWYIAQVATEFDLRLQEVLSERVALTMDDFARLALQAMHEDGGPRHYASELLTLGGAVGRLCTRVTDFEYEERFGGTSPTHEKHKSQIKMSLRFVLFHLSNTLHHFDIGLGEVAEENLVKLSKRAAKGTLKGEGDNR
jgi:NTP pyrophosphatase (non-canonical NTP hydrolase)